MSTDCLYTSLNTSQVLPYVFPMTTWKRQLKVWGKWGLEKWKDPVLVRSLAARLLLLPTLHRGPRSPGQELSFQCAAVWDTREPLGTVHRSISTIIKQLTATHFWLSKSTDSGGLSNGGRCCWDAVQGSRKKCELWHQKDGWVNPSFANYDSHTVESLSNLPELMYLNLCNISIYLTVYGKKWDTFH